MKRLQRSPPKKTLKPGERIPLAEAINWGPRVDPEALAAFDPASKRCTMNCGPAAGDPRSAKERKFLCGDCEILTPQTWLDQIQWRAAALRRELEIVGPLLDMPKDFYKQIMNQLDSVARMKIDDK